MHYTLRHLLIIIRLGLLLGICSVTSTICMADPYKIRPDCTERPFSFEELQAIAADPQVKTINQFLEKIPQDAMQFFTLINNSRSAQRGAEIQSRVRPEFPRVLRTSAQGKLTFSYTCDQNSEILNTIEVFYFDDVSESFKVASFDLRKVGLQDRVKSEHYHNAPTSCKGCHQATAVGGLKPNWPEYHSWGDCQKTRGIGIYGMFDDQLLREFPRTRVASTLEPHSCSVEDDRKTNDAMITNYLDFLESLRPSEGNNWIPPDGWRKKTEEEKACYNALPWHEDTHPNKAIQPGQPSLKAAYDSYNIYDLSNWTKWSYLLYPYQKDSPTKTISAHGKENYALRPNARFTDVYSHLMSRRLARIIGDSEVYQDLKYFVAMEAARCNNLTDEDYTKVNYLLGESLITEEIRNTHFDGGLLNPENQKILFALGKKIGLEVGDWTMEFVFDTVEGSGRQPTSASYNTFMIRKPGALSELGIAEVVQGLLLQKLSDELNTALTDAHFTKGVTQRFGSHHMCIDNLGVGVDLDTSANTPTQSALCSELKAKNDELVTSKLLEESDASLKDSTSFSNHFIGQADGPIELAQHSINGLELLSAARGRTLVQKGSAKCINCHSSQNASYQDYGFVPSESESQDLYDQALNKLKERFKEDNFEGTLTLALLGDSRRMPMNENLTNSAKTNYFSQENAEDVLHYIKYLAHTENPKSNIHINRDGWFCFNIWGTDMPMRINNKGQAQCMAKDGDPDFFNEYFRDQKHCLWGLQGLENCERAIDDYLRGSSNHVPFTCSPEDAGASKWGSYDFEGHWCQIIKSKGAQVLGH